MKKPKPWSQDISLTVPRGLARFDPSNLGSRAVKDVQLHWCEPVALVVVGMALIGATTSVMIVALFTLRERRTDPAWRGRAFASSAALNWVGSPIGSAVAGPVVARSLDAALILGAAAGVLACAPAWRTVPADEQPDTCARRSSVNSGFRAAAA